MIIIGGIFQVIGMWISFITTSITVFEYVYPIFVGIGLGLSIPTCETAAASWYPRHSAFVGGVVKSGMGIGAFLYALIGSKYANPEGSPMIRSEVKPDYYEYYPDSEITLRAAHFNAYALISVILCCLQSIFTCRIHISERALREKL